MTDQLETDLRAVLAQRATTITVDPAAGEDVIADRLRTGDDALATLVPLPGRSSRVRWVAAAAAAIVVVLGAAVAMRDRDPELQTAQPGPVDAPTGIFAAAGSSEEVARAYLADRLELEPADLVLEPVAPEAGDPSDLVGETWSLADAPSSGSAGGTVVLRDLGSDRWEVVESYSDGGASIDSIGLSADGTTVVVRASGRAEVHLSVHTLPDGGADSAQFCGQGTPIGEGATTTSVVPPTLECRAEVALAQLPVSVRLTTVGPDGDAVTLEERLIVEPPDGRDADPGTATTVTAP